MKQIDIKRESKKKNRHGIITQVESKTEVPAIQILDPATGTGTFLREVILQIYDTFRANHTGKSEAEIKKLWNEYVPKQLLPRLNGFELMMAPYAVAHMKLAMVLKDTGYDFESDERLKVVLTNTLEPSSTNASFMDGCQQLEFDVDPLAAEAFEADKTKNNQGINVIIGNPPYSGISSNSNEFISNLIEDYKYIDGVHFGERKHWLQDDYVKFIRYCEHILERSDNGILAFINNHGFIDNPTFRCMRCHLLKSFDSIYIIDLHGNVMKKEISPDGNKDENVFDIMQGVSINIFVKTDKIKKDTMATLYHDEMFGSRQRKYQLLQSGTVNFQKIIPTNPYYFFIPKSETNRNIYDAGFNIAELMPINVTGIVTARDSLVISQKAEALLNIIIEFTDEKKSDAEVRELFFGNRTSGKYLPGDSRGWDLSRARKKIANNDHKQFIKPISYRPFDTQYIYYSNNMVDWGRESVLLNMIRNNVALIIPRQAITDNWSHVGVSDCLVDNRFHYSNKGIPIVCPLYIYQDTIDGNVCTPNLKLEIVVEISEKLGLPFAPDSDGGSMESFAPIDLLDYIYAVLHSPKYRETYKEFLKIDFPRVPYPTDKEIFWKMVELGGEIRKLHLMESPLFDTLITTYPVTGTNEVVKLNRKDNRVYINNEQYFEGISDLAWNFYIGGYQPAQKWLKDRKGRNLSDEDILHYQKIIVALTETDRLMKEIDDIFIF